MSAAGPGCRMIEDLISCSSPSRTAGIASQPATRGDRRRTEFLAAPGAEDEVRARARTTSAGSAMMRSRPSDMAARSAKQSSPPAMPISSRHPADAGDQRLVPFLEVDARAPRSCAAALRVASTPASSSVGERGRLRLAADHAAEHADHAQDLGDAAVVEDVHLDAGAHELRGDVRLQVGEAEHEVGLERADAVDLRAREGRTPAASHAARAAGAR